MKPDLTLIDQVSGMSQQNVRRCYYCLRCSAGCPAAYAMDYTPAQILRLVQLGQKEALLHSSAIWLCIGCETCGTRCPNEIHAGAVIEHKAFLNSIRRFGRLHELSMLLEHKLTSRDLLSNLDMGVEMFVKGKIHPLPKRIQGLDQVQELFELMDEGSDLSQAMPGDTPSL